MITVTFEKGADGKYHSYTHYGDDIPTKQCVEFMRYIDDALDTLNVEIPDELIDKITTEYFEENDKGRH